MHCSYSRIIALCKDNKTKIPPPAAFGMTEGQPGENAIPQPAAIGMTEGEGVGSDKIFTLRKVTGEHSKRSVRVVFCDSRISRAGPARLTMPLRVPDNVQVC